MVSAGVTNDPRAQGVLPKKHWDCGGESLDSAEKGGSHLEEEHHIVCPVSVHLVERPVPWVGPLEDAEGGVGRGARDAGLEADFGWVLGGIRESLNGMDVVGVASDAR